MHSWPVVDLAVNFILFSLLFLQFVACLPYMFKIPAVEERAVLAFVQCLALRVAGPVFRAFGKMNKKIQD